MIRFPDGFLWGAASAPHQIEGNNTNSDWWAREQRSPGMERSGDALDSYHRYAEDMQLLADAGLNSYRFGIEWARIEPTPGHFSRAELAHYRRMIDKALELGLTPVVTLHHFSSPLWFDEEGGWMSERFLERFTAYVTEVTSILDGVEWVCTINEPNMLAFMVRMLKDHLARQNEGWTSPTVEDPRRTHLPDPDPEATRNLIAAHHAARAILRERTSAKVGWTVANEALVPTAGNESVWQEIVDARENPFLIGARGDDFIGVQSYTSQTVDANGIVPHPELPDNTLVGTAYRPDALGIAVRHAWEVTQGVSIMVTENGIATADDAQRIRYTDGALRALKDVMNDGITTVGYLHWSALDNFEWGHWAPTFGLIAVDRETFVRTAKPSLGWLGRIAATNGRALDEASSE
ncbi:beta-glucosidase [Leifsonia sp. Root4]|uniref:family 1 glycosylhydrolase n=1 Tax=Leifsonia sp. Root4 TaxID=1736525 RepID=UPI0006FE3273|nr:family 1 glycosylhydrolase [Leifsonia sp. Root4]KQW05579.1 beta-glucosidase [Leifsonia sp. Root4]